MFEYIKTDNEQNYEHVLFNGEVFSYFDTGLTRRVFVNKDKTKVIKLLIDNYGINHNEIEYEIFNSKLDKSDFAHTEITEDGTIIIQEYVTPIKIYDGILSPKDIKFALSCRNEVGFNKEGKLVCFDLDEYKKY